MIPNSDNKYQEKALGYLTSMFKGRPVIEGLLKVISGRGQDLEDQLWAVINGRLLGTVYVPTPLYDEGEAYQPDLFGALDTEVALDAEGAQLDVLGALVLQPRYGMSDADYILWLKARIRALRTIGTAKDVTEVLQLIAQIGAVFRYEDDYPAGFRVYRDDTETNGISQIVGIIKTARAAGVGGQYYYHVQPNQSTLFTLTDGVTGISSVLGFADFNNPGTGGHMRGAASV